MSAYNFQRRFAEPIRTGAKRSTIRRRRKTGYVPTPGEAIKLYSGQRTRNCQLLAEVKVLAVRPITIETDDHPYSVEAISVDGTRLMGYGVETLAKSEGFSSVEDMAEFFNEKYGPALSAYLIEW